MEYRARADALNNDRRVALPGTFDRGTVAGERASRENLSVLGARQGVIDSEKEVDALGRLSKSQDDMRKELMQRLGTLKGEAGKYYAEAQASGGVDRYVASNKEGYRLVAVQSALKELKDLEQKIEETKARTIQAAAQVGQARIGVMQSQLGVLEGREAVAAGNAQRVGRMNQVDYQASQRAALMVKQFGVDNVPPQVLELYERYAPQDAAKAYEKRGADRLESDKEVNLPFAEFDHGLGDVRKDVDELRKIIANANETLKRDVADEQKSKLLGEDYAKTMRIIARQEAEAVNRAARREAEQHNTKGS